MQRDQLIDAIRAQVDLDEEDLPLSVVKLYLREAFQRTAAMERRWPAYEAVWDYTVGEAGVATLDVKTAEIISVNITENGRRMVFADHELIRSATGYTAGSIGFFSLWGGKLHLWPKPKEDVGIQVSGYRKPNDAWLDSPGLQVDLDDRLHLPLFHYAVSLVYAQQEDVELENAYMRRWESSTREFRDDIMKGNSYRPIVLNGGLDQQRF